MRCIQKIKDFIYKKYYDFGRTDVNIFNFHPQLFIVLAIQGIFFGRRDYFIRFVISFFNTGMGFVGIVLNSLTMYHGLDTEDHSLACESFFYVVLLGAMFSANCGFSLNKANILSLLEQIASDFQHICSLGPRHRKPFLEGQLLVWKLFFGWMGPMVVTGAMFMLRPVVLLLYQSLTASQDEHMRRPLIFPVWLPTDDAYRSPNYQIFFLFQSVLCAMYVLTFNVYIYILLHFLLHYYTIMDMIILDFEVIFDGLDETIVSLPKKHPRRVAVQLELNKRIKRIVTWHISVYKAMEAVSTIFRLVLMYQTLLSALVICLVVYQIAEGFDEGEFNFLFVLMANGAILQIWIPCCLGTVLMNKGFAVGDACWSCGWHETPFGRMVRADIVLIIMRAQMPITIKFTGQPVVQLETFTTIMSTSYSYFNILRQSAKRTANSQN